VVQDICECWGRGDFRASLASSATPRFAVATVGMTVTVCQDRAGTDESSRRAADWVNENLSTPGSPPTITEGETVLRF
jgi:hypothetical protein